MTHEELLQDYPYFFKTRDKSPEVDVLIHDWCEQNFGLSPYRPLIETGGWVTTFSGYYFKNIDDYLLTVLKWS